MKIPCHIALRTSAIVLAGMLFASGQEALGQIGGQPGAFSRMGFGARGIGMGNALTAVTTGDMVGYYNPALLPTVTDHQAAAGFGILSLDRTLNFLNYTQKLPPMAGISFGIINAGVSGIDGRDSDGEPTGELKTSEDQLQLGFGFKLKNGLSLGVNAKLYYYHLYTDVTSVTMGIDFGAFFPINESFAVGATVKDVMSKYKWDTSELLGQDGQQTEVQFPTLYTIGGAYTLPDSLGLVAADVEFSSAKTIFLRFGVEIPIVPELTLRAGIDRIDLKEKGNGIRPAGGFSVRKDLGGWTPSVTYAFVAEPFSPAAMHIVSIGVAF